MPSTSAPLSAFDGLLDLERSRALHAGGVPFDLSGVTALARELGPLTEAPVSIHVAGSEGKTSLCERCAAGLMGQGMRVGSFTSPHLHDPLERLRIGLSLPDPVAVSAAVDEVLAARARCRRQITWFEAMWATARVLFAREGLPACVWETGLGGRLDATRLSPARLCVITSISLEHTALLGNTLARVAAEKAGILRPGVPLLLAADLPPEARGVIERRAYQLGCEVQSVPADPGEPRGLSLARACLRRLELDEHLPPLLPAAWAGLLDWRVAGRGTCHADLRFEGAHSLAAIHELAGGLAREDWRGPILLGVTHGRDGRAMAAALANRADPLVLTRAPGPRGLAPSEMVGDLPANGLHLEPDPERALAWARERRGPGRRILVTGSLYLVARLLPPGSPPA